MNEMNLSTLQKKRLIFLLGPRYKNSNIFKIVYRNCDTLEKNLLKAFEILKLLYIESKWAPIFHPFKSTPKERRVYNRRYFGKTKEERIEKIKENQEFYNQELEKFEKLWENREENFTSEKIADRVSERIEADKNTTTDFDKKNKKTSQKSSLEDLAISKKEFEDQMISTQKLTPTAFKLFFKNDGENQNWIKENSIIDN